MIATPGDEGWIYRIDYPYYSWAETIVRPRIARRDFSVLITQLNETERSIRGRWKPDNREMTSAIKFLVDDGTLAASKFRPDEIANIFRSELLSGKATRAAV